MRYFLKILKDQKVDIKMNNQTDSGFDLILLTDKTYNQIINKLNYCYKKDIGVNIAWEFKVQRNCFKVYKDVEIKEVKENINPFKNKAQGMIITFSCEGVDYYSEKEFDIGRIAPKTSIKYKDSNILLRALKLSNINFDLNIQNENK